MRDREIAPDEHAVPPVAEPVELSSAVAQTVAHILERASQAWPGVHLAEARFREEIGRRVSGGDPLATLRAIHAEDLYLVIACAAGDATALAHFDRVYLDRARQTLARMRLSASEVDETLQALREELFVPAPGERPRILNYAGRANLHGWLRVVAVRVSHRVVRRNVDHAELRESVVDVRQADPELEYLKRTCGDAFQQAFRESLAQMAPRDRLLLKRRFTHGLSCEELGVLYGVNRTTVFRWVTDARARLVEATQATLQGRMDLGSADLSSVLRLVQSVVDLTLSSSVELQGARDLGE